MRILVLVLLVLSAPLSAKEILISFDGSGYFDRWEETLSLAKTFNAKFTYFVSAPYFVTSDEASWDYAYWAESEIGPPLVKIMSPGCKSGVERRRKYAVRAALEGHEIASHLCGHYNGSKWTEDQWRKEFRFFGFALSFLTDLGIPILGVRAPYLAVNDAYFQVASEEGLHYDSSLATKSPVFNLHGVREARLHSVKIIYDGDARGKVPSGTLPFDCAFEEIKQKHPRAIVDAEQVFFDSLVYDYLNGPNPMMVCMHFEHFPEEPYMGALNRFMLWVKDRHPSYLTYLEYIL